MYDIAVFRINTRFDIKILSNEIWKFNKKLSNYCIYSSEKLTSSAFCSSIIFMELNKHHGVN